LGSRYAGSLLVFWVHQAARFLALAAFGFAMQAAAASVATTTTLAITSSSGPATSVQLGTIVTLTATVTAGGAPATSGLVTFCYATAARCADAAVLGRAQLMHNGASAGTATIKMPFSAGSHSVTAVLAANNSYQTSTSATQSLNVTADLATTTALQSTGAAPNYTLNATVAGGPSAAVGPSENVTFADLTNRNTSLGSATLGKAVSSLSFLRGTTLTVPKLIGQMATADINGDGRQDLAVLNGEDNSFEILLGNGDGTFQAPVAYSVAAAPGLICVADFNEDGKLDLAIVYITAKQVSIFLGNGDGTFSPGATLATGNFPGDLKVADLNNDGHVDLVFPNQDDNDVQILLGNGDGTFTAKAPFPAGTSPEITLIGDFNQDGIPDLFALNPFGYTVLLGNGDGTFSSLKSIAIFKYPPTLFAATLGDFNGDGIPDIVLMDGFSDDYLIVFLANGDGTFAQQPTTIPVGIGPERIESADLNGDGILDLVVSITGVINPPGGEVQVFLGNGNGTFNPAPLIPDTAALPYTPLFLSMKDFNGDGIPDIFVANWTYLNLGSTTADIFLNQLSQTATASLAGVCIAGTGTHLVQANYPGDVAYASSSSAPIALNASQVATTIVVSSATATVAYGQAATLTATVTSANGIPAGTVSFMNDGALLGTATLNASGKATLTTTALPAGADAITVSYGGNCPFAASTSSTTIQVGQAPLSVTVANASRAYGTANPTLTGSVSGLIGSDTVTVVYNTTAVTSSPAGTYPISATVSGASAADYSLSVTPGTLTVTKIASKLALTGSANPALTMSSVSFSAQAASSTTGIPTGTVTFSDGSTVLGTATLNSSGLATYTTTNLPDGQHSITASYGGDKDFAPANSSAMAETIADFKLTSSGATTQSVAAGGSATYAFTLTPSTPTLLAPVTLAVSGLPEGATYSFSPATVAAGSGTQTVTLSVVTAAQAASAARQNGPRPGSLVMAAGLLLLPWGTVYTIRGRRRRPLLILSATTIMVLLGVAGPSGCGGGKSPSPAPPAPAAQSYNLSVTASSGVLQHSAAVTLTAQ
jgi:Bacterial Ig-like domain (group 3)/MBG domain (YGX type)/FG-GAP-like repeat